MIPRWELSAYGSARRGAGCSLSTRQSGYPASLISHPVQEVRLKCRSRKVLLFNGGQRRKYLEYGGRIALDSLNSPQIAETLTPTRAATPAKALPYYRPITCGLVLFAADCLALFAVTVIVSWCSAFRWSDLMTLRPTGGTSLQLDLVVLFFALALYLAAKGRYGEPVPFWTETRIVVCASLSAVSAEVVLRGLTNGVPPLNVIITLLAFPILATLINLFSKQVLLSAGFWTHPVIVISDGPSTAETVLEADYLLGYRLVGRVSPDSVLGGPAGNRLRPVMNRYNARRLLIVTDCSRQRQVVECALRERVPFALVPACPLPALPFKPIGLFSQDTILLSSRDDLSRPMARIMKVVFDIVVAAVLLIIVSPLFLVLAIINRLEGGPVLYPHERVGVGGRPFRCLKFRTMVVNADQLLTEALARDPAMAAEWAATRKLANDPRVTRMGRFLRKTSLDELPQLINVLRLEMSLVGPRPIVKSEIPLYGEDIARYHAVRPGVTGVWQVSGRSNIPYPRRVQLDVWYVNNWSFWYDIVVLLKTIPAVLGREGAC